MSKKYLSLQDWIAQMGGRLRVAEILEVHESAVRHWCNGRNFPCPERMARIRRLSDYQISFDHLVDIRYNGKK